MAHVTTLTSGAVKVVDYRCTARPGDASYWEQHVAYSFAYVRKGSFGYRAGGRDYELVPGSFLIGRPGVDYMCTHDHHVCGDECLSFHYSADQLESLGFGPEPWQVDSLPPLAGLVVWAELVQATSEHRTDLAVDEAGLMLTARLAGMVTDTEVADVAPAGAARRRVIDTALWISDNIEDDSDLDQLADMAGLSPYHYLRLFKAVTGATPHQYRIRVRLGRAARLLTTSRQPVTDIAYEAGFGDLSNFVRTFGRAAGVSPRQFRHLVQ